MELTQYLVSSFDIEGLLCTFVFKDYLTEEWIAIS